MTAPDLDTLLKRVHALLTLSEDSGATPHEAANAAAMAQRLILKFNLDLTKVRAAGQQPSAYETRRYELLVKSGPYVEAHRMLLAALARHNFCKVLVIPSTGACRVIGEAHNIELVCELYRTLAVDLAGMAEAALREHQAERRERWPYERLSAAAGISWKRDFLLGACETIRGRLARERHEAEQEAAAQGEQVRALVVVKDQELAEAVKKLHPDTRAGRRIYTHSTGATEAGRAAGNAVALHRREQIAGASGRE